MNLMMFLLAIIKLSHLNHLSNERRVQDVDSVLPKYSEEYCRSRYANSDFSISLGKCIQPIKNPHLIYNLSS